MYIINDPLKRLADKKEPETVVVAPFGIDVEIGGIRYNFRQEEDAIVIRKTSFNAVEALVVLPYSVNQIIIK